MMKTPPKPPIDQVPFSSALGPLTGMNLQSAILKTLATLCFALVALVIMLKFINTPAFGLAILICLLPTFLNLHQKCE